MLRFEYDGADHSIQWGQLQRMTGHRSRRCRQMEGVEGSTGRMSANYEKDCNQKEVQRCKMVPCHVEPCK